MTMRVKLSIHVETENGQGQKFEAEVRSEAFEEDMQEIMHRLGELAGAAVLGGYEAQLKKGAYSQSISLRTEMRSYQFQSFTLRYRRHSYQMPDGRVETPLDEVLGFCKYQRRSWKAKEQSSSLAASISYRKSAQIQTYLSQRRISASTVCRDVRAVGQRISLQEQAFESTQAGQIEAPCLYCESDGLWISLQKSGKRKAEVRVAIAYTGKKYIAKDRRKLLNKTCITSIGLESLSWQEYIRERLYASYDLENTKKVIVGGDGGKWVGHSFDLLGVQSVTRILDPFHVKRNIHNAFGMVLDSHKLIKHLYEQGFDAIEKTLLDKVSAGTKAQVNARLGCLQYLRNHADEIIIGPSLGAIESNVGKLVGQRMKTRGVSWSLAGAQAMLAILSHQEQLFEHSFQYDALPLKPSRKSSARTQGDTASIHSASFPILNSGKISAPYAKLFKDIINDNLPLSS